MDGRSDSAGGLTGTALGNFLAVSFLIGLSGLAWAGHANVTFVNSDSFTDIGIWDGGYKAVDNQAEIARHIGQLAGRDLPEAQQVDIEILDVDLAGRLEPKHRTGDEVRVMRRVTWPSVRLRYRLRQGDQLVAQGEETIADMDYMERPNPYPEGDPLRYEKRMLDRWFHQRLVELLPASH
jgi:Protein of unknown function (DUF3016)